MAERQRSGVTEAFSRSGRCRGRAIVRLLRAVLVALLNVVRVDSPGTFGAVLEFRGHHRRCRRRRRRPGVGWALATVTPPPIAPAASVRPPRTRSCPSDSSCRSPFPWLSRLAVVPTLSLGPCDVAEPA